MTATLPTLHDLADARDILDMFLLEAEGELTPELADLFERLDGTIEEKIERWALWVADRAGKAKEIKAEEERLAARRRAIENACERSKAELKRQMERIGKLKVNGVLCAVAIQQNSQPSVSCALDSETLRAAYFDNASPLAQFVVEIPATYRVAASAVLEAQKQGETIPDSIAIERGTYIRIR